MRTFFIIGVIFCALCAIPAISMAGWSAGGEIDLNIFQLIGEGDVEVSAGNLNESGDLDFNAEISPGIGFTLYYEQPKYFIGGKLYLSSVDGDGEVDVDGYKDDGNVDVDFRQIGPWGGYYFREGKMKPMILGGLTFNQCTIDPVGGEEGAINMLGIHIGGGVKYFVTEKIAIGGGGRLDYYATISDYDESVDVRGVDGNLKADLTWAPITGFFLTEYHWGN